MSNYFRIHNSEVIAVHYLKLIVITDKLDLSTFHSVDKVKVCSKRKNDS